MTFYARPLSRPSSLHTLRAHITNHMSASADAQRVLDALDRRKQ